MAVSQEGSAIPLPQAEAEEGERGPALTPILLLPLAAGEGEQKTRSRQVGAGAPAH